ncbi:MAG: hypothetical protein AB1790_09840 [Pseudomonadota bacterium]
MGISASEIEALAALANHCCASGDDPAAALRRILPRITVTQCAAADVVETPFATGEYCDLHLVDGSSHCWQLTTDPTAATGVLLAMHRP